MYRPKDHHLDTEKLDLLGFGGQEECSRQRKIVVRLPKDAGGGLRILLRSLYRTRDASECWKACIAEVLKKHSFVNVCSSGGGEGLIVFVHGNEFATLGSPKQCRWFRECLRKELGAQGKRSSCSPRLEIQLGTAPRHIEILCCKHGTPDVFKGSDENHNKTTTEDILESDEVTQFRSLSMKAAYRSLDRPHQLYVVKVVN